MGPKIGGWTSGQILTSYTVDQYFAWGYELSSKPGLRTVLFSVHVGLLTAMARQIIPLVLSESMGLWKGGLVT